MTGIKRFRSIPALIVLSAMAFWSTMASADHITVDFLVKARPGGPALIGSFSGRDANGNGFLGHFPGGSELSAFELTWTGTNRTNPFRHGLSDLRALLYNITRDRLHLFISRDRADRTTAALINFPYFGISVAGVNGPGARPHGPQIVWHPYVGTRPTAVPEPGTLTLFGMGLLAIGFASRRRRFS